MAPQLSLVAPCAFLMDRFRQLAYLDSFYAAEWITTRKPPPPPMPASFVAQEHFSVDADVNMVHAYVPPLPPFIPPHLAAERAAEEEKQYPKPLSCFEVSMFQFAEGCRAYQYQLGLYLRENWDELNSQLANEILLRGEVPVDAVSRAAPTCPAAR